MKKLLLIEDDPGIGSFLERGLTQEGFRVTLAGSGEQGINSAMADRPDIIVLDVMLPDFSGLEVCQRLRANRFDTPVLMLTALDSTEHKVTGLRTGADDYLTKPFDVDELLARIHALLRRGRHSSSASFLQAGDLSIDFDRLDVTYRGSALDLTGRELALLELLMRSPGEVFTRERILDNVWGQSENPLANIVDVYIRRLRQKLDDQPPYSLIRTVRSRGYKLHPD